MGALKMESEDLRRLGNDIIGNSESFDSLISNYQAAYQAITASGTWDGVDSNGFNEAATKFKADLDKASALLKEVGTNLVATANSYESTNSDITSSISSLM